MPSTERIAIIKLQIKKAKGDEFMEAIMTALTEAINSLMGLLEGLNIPVQDIVTFFTDIIAKIYELFA